MRKFWLLYLLFPLAVAGLFAFGNYGFLSVEASQTEVTTMPASTKPVVFSITPGLPDPNTTLNLVNESRKLQGLSPLLADETLGKLAKARATDMATKQYYAHMDPSGNYYYDYFTDYGITTTYSCENLDLVFEPDQEVIISDWMNSPKGHRECLLNTTTARAGYASTELRLVQPNGTEISAYVVVAIHAKP